MEYMSKEKFEEAEKQDKLRTKMLKFIMYKKRTEQEVRQKFQDEDENMVEDAIEFFKENNYINDFDYVDRAIKEYMAIKHLSIMEVSYKICQKGINKSIVDDYICKNKETMLEYEISSAKAIITKKMNDTEIEEIKNYLYKKGYMSESISIALDEIEEANE
jgi:SOS response regulatory protein OraA/RecX